MKERARASIGQSDRRFCSNDSCAHWPRLTRANAFCIKSARIGAVIVVVAAAAVAERKQARHDTCSVFHMRRRFGEQA